jgi:para-aminobenzoate synthetase component I
LINTTQIIQYINSLGAARQAFVFLIDFEMQKPVIIPVATMPLHKQLKVGNITIDFSYQEANPCAKTYTFQKFPISFESFSVAFNHVKQHILGGNTFLLNLTAPTRIETSLSLQEIFDYSQAKYKVLYESTDEKFVCFSPETFIKIENDRLSTYPMKGTANADLPNAKEQLLASQKELYEHATIVDLLRNDLAMVSNRRHVERFRYIEEIRTHDKTLLQVSSEIQAKLSPNYHQQLGDILFRLLPAGSISGAPKTKTLNIIQQAEQQPRGYYTGIAGYYDGTNVDSCVLIRYIEETKQGMFFRSGGGITFMSDAEKEYQELIDKVYLPIF